MKAKDGSILLATQTSVSQSSSLWRYWKIFKKCVDPVKILLYSRVNTLTTLLPSHSSNFKFTLPYPCDLSFALFLSTFCTSKILSSVSIFWCSNSFVELEFNIALPEKFLKICLPCIKIISKIIIWIMKNIRFMTNILRILFINF